MLNRRFDAMITARGMLIAAAAVAVGLAYPAPAAAECKLLQVAEFQVDTNRNQVVFDGELNSQPIKVLIDTGAEISVIWRPAAARLGLKLSIVPRARMYGIGGESVVEAAYVSQLKLGNFTAKNWNLFVAGDIQGGFDMVLGQDFFSKHVVEFDLQHHAVRLFQPRGCRTEQLVYWSTTYSLADIDATALGSHRIETTVMLNGKKVHAIVDSGAAMSIVTKFAAARAGVEAEGDKRESVQLINGFGRKSSESWIGTFDSFAFGDESLRNARLRIADLNQYNRTTSLGSRLESAVEGTPDMMIGADFLMSHRMMIDVQERKIVFTYLGGKVFQTVHLDGSAAAAPAISESQPH
jgi:predicted aspartyl protease